MARLVAVEARGADFVAELQRRWDAGDAVLPVDPRLPRSAAVALVDALDAGEPVEPGTALVVPTSGTTGAPKGVVLTHAMVAASAQATSDHLGIDPSRHTWLACLPLAHVGGLSVVTRALHRGTGLVVHDGFDADAVDAAADAGATHVSLVGTALARIDASRWQHIVLGGSAPPADRPGNSSATYGLTETGSGVVYDGVPLEGVEVAIGPGSPDADDGDPDPDGGSDGDGVGEILLRGPMVARAYRDGTAVIDDDGWLHTGDLGTWAAGVVAVHGRRGDMIITGGENVHPDPVEARLRAHAAIADVAVIGRSDPEWGQRVTAVVVVADGHPTPSLEVVRDWVRATLPAWAAPKAIEVVEDLPRTALGKVRRAELRARP